MPVATQISMVGILVIVLVSWLLLHFVEDEHLFALGIRPYCTRAVQLLLGFLFLATVNVTFVLIESQLKATAWSFNFDWQVGSLFDSLWYHTKSAVTEELIFRGALLYILIKRIGTNYALIISAFCFGIYHLFSYGMIGGPIVPIIFVIVTTGLMGYAWAYAFAKTNSIMLPLGMHIAWNFVTTLYGDVTPYGELLYKAQSVTELSDGYATFFSIFKGLFVPFLVYTFVFEYFKQKT